MISERIGTTLDGLLQGIVDDPVEDRYSILADYLEEYDDSRRAELLRLHRKMLNTCCEEIQHTERVIWHARITELLGQGVVPSVPQQMVSVHGVEMVFNFIPPGTFLMGSPPSEEGRFDQEGPHHWVMMAKGFYLGTYPVTQAQWQAVMGDNPSNFKGEDRPVEEVSWYDCQEFCKKLEEMTGKQFRLPTETEWEYSCRAGTTTPFHFGDTISTDQANYNGNHTYGKSQVGDYIQQTTLVSTFQPNAWGLYDMHGNVWEWCQDCYGPYCQGEIKDSESDDVEGPYRVIRGGSWYSVPRNCRSAVRKRIRPGERSSIFGFRAIMDV